MRSYLGLVILIFLIFFGGVVELNNQDRKGAIAFRYDDYSSRSDNDIDIMVMEAFKKYNLPYTLGVIPFVTAGDPFEPSQSEFLPLSEEKIQLLRDELNLGNIEVALHGFSHQVNPTSVGGTYTEFANLDDREQKRRVVTGRDFLIDVLGVPIVTFIPPWNSYDLSTLKVLEKTNFKVISADAEGATKSASHLSYLPATVELRDLRKAIDTARKIQDDQSVIVVLVHFYDFAGAELENSAGISIREFEEILSWVASQEDFEVSTIAQITQSSPDFTSERLSAYQRFLNNKITDFLPAFIAAPDLYRHLYPSMSSMQKYILRSWLFVAVYYPLILLASALFFYVGSFFFRIKIIKFETVIRFGSLLLIVASAYYFLSDLDIGFIGASMLTLQAGMCLGLWMAYFRNPGIREITQIKGFITPN